MSQVGPYGPGNPPPPPPGPPPSARARHGVADSSQQSQQAGKIEKSFRKLNSRQRRSRKADEAANGQKESRPPVRGEEEDNQARDKDGHDHRGRSRHSIVDEHDYRSQQVEHDSRQPLGEARQMTPSQALDETYGRLSPGLKNQYEQARGDAHLRPVTQNGWPDGRSWSPRRGGGEYTREASQGRGRWSNFIPRSADRLDADGEGARQAALPTNAAPSHPMTASGVFEMEDEVDWDDDELDAPAPVESHPANEFRGNKPQQSQQVAYKGSKSRPKGQGKKRAFSPARGEQPWAERPWMNKSQKTRHPIPSSIWGPNPSQRQPEMHFPVAPPFSQPPQHNLGGPPYPGPDMSSFKGRKPRVSEQALLEPDPALLHQGLPVPETVYDLRDYDAHITALHRGLPEHQRYINGNGKVSPYNYGSVPGLDLGICFATFSSSCQCEMGVKCAWRHHPLTKAEREWILSYGGEKGRVFLENLPKRWAVPDVPVPGATMHDK